MSRIITRHIVSQDQAHQLEIQVLDQPGAGGANHAYAIYGFHTATNPSATNSPFDPTQTCLPILFQNGPIPESGVNGITQEALLAIVIDRLQSFQAGPYPSHYNSQALYHARQALDWLQARTLDRIQRQVEGKNQA